MTAADTEPWGRIKEFIYWLIINKTPAQPPIKGHLPWSRGCPLNRDSTVIKVLVILVQLAYISTEYIQSLIV